MNEDSVLELVTQALTECRVNDKMQQSEEYRQARQAERRAYDILTSDLDEKQKQRLDDFISSAMHHSAIWEKLVYQQGMKDLLELFRSLT